MTKPARRNPLADIGTHQLFVLFVAFVLIPAATTAVMIAKVGLEDGLIAGAAAIGAFAAWVAIALFLGDRADSKQREKDWHTIDLGGADNPDSGHWTRTNWRPREDGHLLTTGHTNTGKTHLLQRIIWHTGTRPRNWRVYVIDPTGEHQTALDNYPKHIKIGVHTIAGADGALDVLQEVHAETRRRLATHETRRKRTPAILLLIDDAHRILGNDDADALEAATLLTCISRDGQAAGVHVAIAAWSPTQLPDDAVNNIPHHITFSDTDHYATLNTGNRHPFRVYAS